jgi:small-conductance mechanosensitive channel
MYAVNLTVFRALKEARITIPFPQREVRMLSN